MNPIVNADDINYLLKADLIFKHIHDAYGAPSNWSRPQGFISLSQIILEQQVSLASAKAHFNKLNQYLTSFTPENILRLSDSEMRKCQISRQKATYLRELSKAILNGNIDLTSLPDLNDNEVKKLLTGIKGIGNWTAEIYLMFCLQAKDIFPAGDIAIVITLGELTQMHSKEDLMEHAEKWRPVRSLASYFLWHYYLRKRNRSN